jgi:hypothetical protein
MANLYKKVRDALESIKGALTPRRSQTAHERLSSRLSTGEPLKLEELDDIRGLCKEIAEPSCHGRIDERFGILRDIAEARRVSMSKRVPRRASIEGQLGSRKRKEKAEKKKGEGRERVKRRKSIKRGEEASLSQASARSERKHRRRTVRRKNDVSWGVLPRKYWSSGKTDYSVLEKALSNEDKKENLYLHLGDISTDEEEEYFSEENVGRFNAEGPDEEEKRCKFGDAQYNCRDCMEYEIRQEYEKKERINNKRLEQEARKRREQARRRWEDKMPKSFFYLEEKMGGNRLLARYFTDEHFSMDDLEDEEKEELDRMLAQKKKPELFDIDSIEGRKKSAAFDEEKNKATEIPDVLKVPGTGVGELRQEDRGVGVEESAATNGAGRDIEETPIFLHDEAAKGKAGHEVKEEVKRDAAAPHPSSLPPSGEAGRRSEPGIELKFPSVQPQGSATLDVPEQRGDNPFDLAQKAPLAPGYSTAPPAFKPFSFDAKQETPAPQSLFRISAPSISNGFNLKSEPFLFRSSDGQGAPKSGGIEGSVRSPLQLSLGISQQPLFQPGPPATEGAPSIAPGKRKLGLLGSQPSTDEESKKGLFGTSPFENKAGQEQTATNAPVASASLPFARAPPLPQAFGFIGSSKELFSGTASSIFSGKKEAFSGIGSSQTPSSGTPPFFANSPNASGLVQPPAFNSTPPAWTSAGSIELGSGKSLFGDLLESSTGEEAQLAKPSVGYLNQDDRSGTNLSSLLGGRNVFGDAENDPFVRKGRPGSKR